jgi:hypothetical protein
MTDQRLDIEATASGRATLAASRSDRASSIDALRALEEIAYSAGPSRPEAWRDDVLGAIDELITNLQHQYQASQAENSLLSQVADDSPHLAGSVEALRSRETVVIEDLQDLRAELADYSRTPDIASMRSALAGITVEIREIRAWEADLVYEAYYVDLGVVG